MTISITNLDAALAYAARGWHVVALHTPAIGGCSCGNMLCDSPGKHPRFDLQLLPNGLKNATTEPGIIHVWWSLWLDANIGLTAGIESGFWALDIDPDKGGDLSLEALLAQHGPLPDTPTARTGSGGQHLLFAHPGTPIRNRVRFAPGLDTRGDGGYIVASPSLHASGALYDWQIGPDDAPLAPAPAWLLQLVCPPAQTAPPPTNTNGAHPPLPKRTLIYLVWGAQNGTRNDELYKAAQQFYAASYSQAEADQKLRPRAKQDGLDDAEISKTIASAYKSTFVSGPAAAPGTTSTSATTGPQPSTGTQATPAGQAAGKHSAFIAGQLATMGYAFRLNTCTDSIEVNGVRLDDVLHARIRQDCRDAGVKPLSAVEDVMMILAQRDAYHPVREYLGGLVWDGQSHIGRLAQYLTCDDPEVDYGQGVRCSLAHVYLYRWMIGACARVYEYAQNMMPVLAGPQNIGKSTLVRWLCSGIGNAFFVEGPIDLTDKDTLVRIITAFIWEVGEVDATTRRADTSALKDVLTRREITVRKPYGRHDIVKPVLANFIGTINPTTGFLTDESGNRRFQVVTLSAIDHHYQQDLDVNQLWAEAKAAYDRGEPWRLLPVELALQTEQNKQHEVETTLEGHILKHFDIGPTAHGQRMTAGDIVEHLAHQGIAVRGSGHAQACEVSRVLTHLGVIRVRTSSWRGYEGIFPK